MGKEKNNECLERIWEGKHLWKNLLWKDAMGK